MNMFSGLGSGTGVANNPDGCAFYAMSRNTRMCFCCENLNPEKVEY